MKKKNKKNNFSSHSGIIMDDFLPLFVISRSIEILIGSNLYWKSKCHTTLKLHVGLLILYCDSCSHLTNGLRISSDNRRNIINLYEFYNKNVILPRS